jgi:hypothetical protein
LAAGAKVSPRQTQLSALSISSRWDTVTHCRRCLSCFDQPNTSRVPRVCRKLRRKTRHGTYCAATHLRICLTSTTQQTVLNAIWMYLCYSDGHHMVCSYVSGYCGWRALNSLSNTHTRRLSMEHQEAVGLDERIQRLADASAGQLDKLAELLSEAQAGHIHEALGSRAGRSMWPTGRKRKLAAEHV